MTLQRRLAPVARVSLESSRSREMLGKSVREFRIGFTVDLERRWRLPELAGGAIADAGTGASTTGSAMLTDWPMLRPSEVPPIWIGFSLEPSLRPTLWDQDTEASR